MSLLDTTCAITCCCPAAVSILGFDCPPARSVEGKRVTRAGPGYRALLSTKLTTDKTMVYFETRVVYIQGVAR